MTASRLLARPLVALFAALALSLLLGGCGEAGRQPPRASGGVIDLRDWDFVRDGPLALDGQWELLWKTFEPPDLAGGPQARPGLDVPVPAAWNGLVVDGAPLGGEGHGTYRLVVDCYQARGLALLLPVQHSAARYHVNGRVVAQQGSPGASPERAWPAPVQQIVQLDDLTCPLRVVVHVSNFDVRRGGLLRSITLGTREAILGQREASVVRDMFTLSGLTILAVLPALFFAMRRRDRTPLYFALFCLSFALGAGMTGTRVLQPWLAPLGWDGYFKLLFLTWYLSVTLFAQFLQALYPQQFRPLPMRIIALWGWGSCVLVAFTPASVFSLSVPLLQAGAALSAAYMVVVLVRALWQGQRSAAALLGGLAALAAGILHDTLNYAQLSQLSLLPYGLLVFVLAPALLLARRFARALSVEELRALEQRERADLLVRSTRAGLLDWDATTGQVSYSGRYREMLGLPGAAQQPRLPPFYDLIHPDEREQVREGFLSQLRDHGVRSAVRSYRAMEYRMHHSSGEYIWVHAEGIGLCDADGRTLRFICSFIDISERKRQEIDLSNRVKFISDLFESMPLALALRDEDGRYMVVNRTWERYVGLPRERVLGTSLKDIDNPSARSTLALDRRALEAGPDTLLPPTEYDYNGRRLMQTRTVMVDAQGQRIGVLAASVDISDRHRVEEALATERERLQLLVRSTSAGFGDWDAVRDVVTYTDRFKQMLGWPPDTDTSAWPSLFELMHPQDRERAREQFRAMLRRRPGAGPGIEVPGAPMSYRLRRRDGSYIWIHAEGIAQLDETGRTVRFITSYLDVTPFHEQEEALRASRDQVAAQAAQLERQNEMLKENVRLREEVERIARHDIKTPLNSIIAVPRLLREEGRLSPDQAELLGVVERAGYRILSMVNLSLDLYKMENGSYIFRPDAVDLAALVDKVWADLRNQAAARQVTLRVEAGAPPPMAWAEELLCYSLLANLLKNAVEASPPGAEVTVRFDRVPDGAGDAVQVHLHNAGEIPAAMREHFFQKYATSGKASGTGLGSYSARLMARVQDGDVTMQSSAGQGTTLTVRLRAAAPGRLPVAARHAAQRRADPLRAADLPPLRVLLVDDDEYNLLIVRRFLPSPPLQVQVAVNGRAALERAQDWWPDLVIMDLDMPVMGGLEAVMRLRALEREQQRPRCHVVALSSHDDDDTRAHALAAGFDRYLAKPVTRDVVAQAVLGLVPARDEGAAQDDLAALMPGFIASRREIVDALEPALAAGEREQLRQLAHRLAGGLSLYGLHDAAACARGIEAIAERIDEPALQAAVRSLRRYLDEAAAPGAVTAS